MNSAKVDQILELVMGVDSKLSSLSQRVSNVEKIVAQGKEGKRQNSLKDAQNWISTYTKEYRQTKLAKVINYFFQLKRRIFSMQKQGLSLVAKENSVFQKYANLLTIKQKYRYSIQKFLILGNKSCICSCKCGVG